MVWRGRRAGLDMVCTERMSSVGIYFCRLTLRLYTSLYNLFGGTFVGRECFRLDNGGCTCHTFWDVCARFFTSGNSGISMV